MARSGGYVVLNTYPSSSSDALYEVRRGGDGVLYCTCRGWLSNLNAQKRQGSRDPAVCKHTRGYVGEPRRTLWGRAWSKSPPARPPLIATPAKRQPIPVPKAQAIP